jgi:hypothetical protein
MEGWSDLAVEVLESVKSCSLALNNINDFILYESELLNFKQEPFEAK